MTREEEIKQAANEMFGAEEQRRLRQGFIKGAEWQRQQMMKEAVHAWVNVYESITNPYDNQVSFITNLSPSKYRDKETAKIIILKTE